MDNDNEREIITLVTRGFAGIDNQLREREARMAQLSEKMVGVELKLEMMKEILSKVESNEGMKIRVANLEDSVRTLREKGDTNARYILGLLIGFIMSLLGIIGNFIMARIKQ